MLTTTSSATPAAAKHAAPVAAKPAAKPVEDVADLPPRVRMLRAMRALAGVVADPDRTDLVLEFSNLINAGRREEALDAFYNNPAGAKLYAEARALDSHTIDLDRLAALPEGTLGHAYARFMKSHGLTPDVFDGSPPDVHDPRAAYIIQRIRQTHDLWHVVTNCETDPAGEVALQAFTFAQLHAPSSAVLAAVGMLKGVRKTRQIVRDTIALYRRGLDANELAVFAWEDHWTTPLTEVRALLGLPENPARTGGYSVGWQSPSKMAA